MPELIYRQSPDLTVSPAFFYTVAAEIEIRVLSVTCGFDSTGESKIWSPYLSVNPPGPISDIAVFGQDIKAAPNDIIGVTWAPQLAPPPAAFAAGAYFTQTGMPELTLTHGWGLKVTAFLADGSNLTATNTVLSGLAIMVDVLRGADKFALLNPVLVHKGSS